MLPTALQLTLRTALAAAALAACSSPKIVVTTNAAPAVDFDAKKTYAWLPEAPESDREAEVMPWVRAAVNRDLAGKGYQLVPFDEASMVVEEILIAAERTRTNDPYYAVELYETYEEGSMILDFIDPLSRTILWRGVATTEIKGLDTDEARQARVDEVVSAIMDRFPPR